MILDVVPPPPYSVDVLVWRQYLLTHEDHGRHRLTNVHRDGKRTGHGIRDRIVKPHGGETETLVGTLNETQPVTLC